MNCDCRRRRRKGRRFTTMGYPNIFCVCAVSMLLLMCAPWTSSAMQLQPATSEREVFTGESFVVTCQESISEGIVCVQCNGGHRDCVTVCNNAKTVISCPFRVQARNCSGSIRPAKRCLPRHPHPSTRPVSIAIVLCFFSPKPYDILSRASRLEVTHIQTHAFSESLPFFMLQI